MRVGKAHKGKAKVRTGLGKPDRPGSQGGLWKHGDYGSRTEDPRETEGLPTVPYHYACATFLSRLRTEGAFPQRRVIGNAPRDVSKDELKGYSAARCGIGNSCDTVMQIWISSRWKR